MLNLADVYGAEYLQAMQPGPETVVVPSPENAFNQGQSFDALKAFGQFVQFAEASSAPGMIAAASGALSEVVRSTRRVKLRRNRRSVVMQLNEGIAMSDIRAAQPGLAPRSVKTLWAAWLRVQVFDMQGTLGLLANGHRTIDIVVREAGTNTPLQGVYVQLIYSRAQDLGVEVYTDAFGKARIFVPAAFQKAEAIAVQPLHSYWPMMQLDPDISGATITFDVQSIAAHPADTLRTVLSPGTPTDGVGVRIAIVDGGIGPHPDLVVAGGANVTSFEDPADAGSHLDNGFGHGTHVAGIVAGRGITDPRFAGLAPGAELYSYRVMTKGKRGADDVAVAEAIDLAIEQGCHLINLSLGGSSASREVSDAVLNALARGVVVIAAAGNGSRKPVEFPASLPGVIAVSALGEESILPPGSMAAAARVPPIKPGPNCPTAFIGAFSNAGPEIDLTAPGVGVISTYPNGTYAVSDGTSMAAPAITGLAARALSKNSALLSMPPTQARSDAITHLVLTSATKCGFGPNLEGKGLLA